MENLNPSGFAILDSANMVLCILTGIAVWTEVSCASLAWRARADQSVLLPASDMKNVPVFPIEIFVSRQTCQGKRNGASEWSLARKGTFRQLD